MREEKIFEATKQLEQNKISPDDFLSRMTFNDPQLNEFFSNMRSVDASVEQDVDFVHLSNDDANIQTADDQQIDIESLDIVPASPEEDKRDDPTKCMYCESSRRVNLVTSCGHFSCDVCWNTWVGEQSKLLDKSDEPVRTIRMKRKNPKCMYCSIPTTSTTRVFFPF